VARLGNGEKQRDLNRRRLHNVRDGLTTNLGINDRQIVVAEGNRDGTIQTIVAAFVLNAFVALVTMSVVCGVAAVVRSVQSKVALHHGGI